MRLGLLIVGLALMASVGCGNRYGQLKTRFAQEHGCSASNVTVRKLGAGAFVADGCGRRAQYACATNTNAWGAPSTVCVRDDGPVAARSAGSSAPYKGQANVARKYDEARKMKTVVGSFKPASNVTITLAGAPSAKLGEILVELKASAYLMRGKCETLEVLVNAVPTPTERVTTSGKGSQIAVQGRVDFQAFKPLAQQYSTLGVRACGHEAKLDDSMMGEVQKFFVIYSELATEAQEATQTPATTEPPIDDATKSL